ncbi:MAG: DUF4340 domain-containing protein [Planctomycetota bacterium]|nr:DUF4340 domain-containing protein [Planctomycetota bacterium]
MKYTTTLALAAIVLALAILIYVYHDQLTGPAKPPERPSETLALLKDVKMDDLVSATLEEPAGEGKFKTKMALKKAEGKWRITEPVDGAADDYEVGRLLRAAVEGKYRQSVEPGAKGQPTLASLGLEPPAFRLVLATAAKGQSPARTITVGVGRRSALGEGLYVRVDDQPKAAILERADLLERARDKTNTYRGRDLVALAREDVVRIGLDGEKGKAQIDRSDKDKDRWVMAQPMAARVDPEVASSLVRAALGPSAKEFIEDDPKDLARYGLDKPRLTVTLWKQGPPPQKPGTGNREQGTGKDGSGSPFPVPRSPPSVSGSPFPVPGSPLLADEKPQPVKAATLRFGAWADIKNETVYFLTDDGKHVVSVEASNFKDLDKGPTDLRDKHVLALDTSKATKATVKLPAKLAGGGAAAAGIAYELARKDGKWMLLAAGQPEAKADAAAVEGLLKELDDLKVLYFAEGDHADVAKGFAPQGSLRIQAEGEAAEQGFDIGGPGETASLLKNLREDWIGRVNEKGFTYLAKGWLDYLDKQVFSFDPKKVKSVAIQTADRKVVLEKKDDAWKMLSPVEAEPAAGFAPDLLGQVQDLRCDKYAAATKDLKPYNLEKPELVCTVTLAPEKEGEKPVEKVLALSHYEKSRIAGRADQGDLVFEVPATVFTALAAEPLEKTVTDLPSADVKDLQLATDKARVRLVRIDSKWFRADAKGTPGEEVPADAARDIAQAAASMSAIRWAAYDAKEPAKFGLDKPAATIKITTDKASATLLISGQEVPAGVAALVDQKPARYAMTEGGKRIAIVAGKPVETLLGAAAAFEPKKEEPKKEAPAVPEGKAEGEKAK